MTETLVATLDQLLERAISSARTPEAGERLTEARSRLLGPLRLAIAGKVKAGKSTLLNAIIGEELAATDAGECTKVLTWYHWGTTPQVTVHPLGRGPVLRRWSRQSGALEVDLTGLSVGDVDRIDVAWPTSRLQDLTILDTPGIASISADISDRTHRVLAADDGRVPVADAVLYLMRHTHASDVRFLESFHDDELAHGTPMNSIGVLSRADEIGSCRLDAMEVADRIAKRYERDRRIRQLCPIVVPVDGLLAHASVTLQEREYARLATIAAAPPGDVGELLLTADRFLTRPTEIQVSEGERAILLDRFGLFGVRLSVDLISGGEVGTASELAPQLAERSGLNRLRALLLRQFDRRSRILKARSALAELNDVLRSGGCDQAGPLLGAAEELAAGTHEFEELRLLGSLRSGLLDLKPDRLEELDRLLGGSGHDPSARLGLAPDASAQQVREAALAALAVWKRTAEHPLSGRPVQTAAGVAIRTLEGLVDASRARG